MGRLYKCNQPKCKGHDTFSASCSKPVVQDYPALHDFIEMLETQPIKVPVQVLEPVAPVVQPKPEPVVAAVGTSSSSNKHFDFWSE